MVTNHQVKPVPHLTILDSALLSWLTSSHRLSTCPNCGRRARIRRNTVICSYCRASWPVGDLQDFIAEIEANLSSTASASSRVTARAQEPSPSSDPGLTVFSPPVMPPGSYSTQLPGGADETPPMSDDYIYRLNVQLNRELREDFK